MREQGRRNQLYKTLQSAIAVENQKQWGAAMLELMQMPPYHQITITDISHHLHSNRQYFYRYFERKDDILALIIDEALTVTIQPTISGQSVNEILIGYFTRWLDCRELLAILHRDELDQLLQQRTAIWLTKYYFPPRPGEQTVGQCGTLYTNMISAEMVTMLSYWCEEQFRQSPADLVNILYRFHNSF